MSIKKSTYRDPNHELIRQCKKGRQKAQMQVYKLYYKAMFNTSLRIVNNSSDAEDVMQNSFLDAFERLNQYKEEGSFGGWLKKIVINNSLDFVKKRKSHAPINEDHHIIASYDETELDEEVKIQDIKNALDKLKDDYRIIISLYLFEGYDHEEISHILEISYNLSRTRYSRAKGKLLEEIQLIQKERKTQWIKSTSKM